MKRVIVALAVMAALGTDPFTQGCSMGNPFGGGQGFYKRLPRPR